MTNRERCAIIRAIRYIHSDDNAGGDYAAGMDILARLAGLSTSKSELLNSVRSVPFSEIASRRNNTSFGVTLPIDKPASKEE